MAIGLVGVLVAASRLTRQFARLLDHLESDLKPLLGHLTPRSEAIWKRSSSAG
jgi:hypothetical protein